MIYKRAPTSLTHLSLHSRTTSLFLSVSVQPRAEKISTMYKSCSQVSGGMSASSGSKLAASSGSKLAASSGSQFSASSGSKFSGSSGSKFSGSSGSKFSGSSGSKLAASSSNISSSSTSVQKNVSVSQPRILEALNNSGLSSSGTSSMVVGGMYSAPSVGSNMISGLGSGSSMAFCSTPSFQVGCKVAAGGMRAITGNMGSMRSMPPMLTRDGEQQILRTLNQRFMVYMEKVQSLTQENAMLEAELLKLTGSTSISIETEAPVDASARFLELRTTLNDITVQNVRFEIELDNLRTMAGEMQAKYDFEIGVKSQLESDIVSMRQDLEAAMDIKVDLESKYNMLIEEIEYLKKTQEEELAMVGIKLTTTDSNAIKVDNRSVDLATILSQFRENYNAISNKNTEEAEEYYKSQMQRFELENREAAAVVTTTNTETIEITKTVQEMHMQLQGLQMRHSSLQQMLMELEGQFQNQIGSLQSQAMEQESSMEHHRAELQRQLVAFRTLMDIKVALDQEIATYRKILEGVSLNVKGIDMNFGGCAQTSTTSQFSTSSTGSTGQVQIDHHSHSNSAVSQSSMSQHSGCSIGEVEQSTLTTTKEIITERTAPIITKKITTQVFEMQDGEVVSESTSTKIIQ